MFKLKEFRNAHGLFQAQMAEILGTTQSTLSRMETEKIELNITQYNKLYEKFGKDAVDAYKIDAPEIFGVDESRNRQKNGKQSRPYRNY